MSRLLSIFAGATGLFMAAVLAAQTPEPTPQLKAPPPPPPLAAENSWNLDLSTGGRVVIQLRPDMAPNHVERIKTLTRQGFYNGLVFFRVIEGFMAQTGDVQFGKADGPDFNPGRAGTGGSDQPDVVAEFSDLHYDRGTLGAARTADPNTFNSQFFITLADAGFLDGQYTIFGKVVSGMEFVDNIIKGEPPTNPDKIVSAKIEYR